MGEVGPRFPPMLELTPEEVEVFTEERREECSGDSLDRPWVGREPRDHEGQRGVQCFQKVQSGRLEGERGVGRDQACGSLSAEVRRRPVSPEPWEAISGFMG